jgi:hypothetical protein
MAEPLSSSLTPHGIHIDGFPDAVKVLQISSPKGRRLADLALHKIDLEFALECLTAINSSREHIVRNALWRSAVITFVKCFGNSRSRFSLDFKKIFKGDKDAFEPFEYFVSLRNKHYVHDENSYAQCMPGAILNRSDMDFKIAKIICMGMIGDTLEQNNWANLHRLATLALNWVIAQFDELCEQLTAEYESMPYDDLIRMESITYTAPSADDMHTSRKAN